MQGARTAPNNITSVLRLTFPENSFQIQLQERSITPTASDNGRGETVEGDASLGRMLASVVTREMKHCNLVIVYDDGYENTDVLNPVLALSNPRQVCNEVA